MRNILFTTLVSLLLIGFFSAYTITIQHNYANATTIGSVGDGGALAGTEKIPMSNGTANAVTTTPARIKTYSMSAPTFTTSITGPSYISNAADGTHFIQPYNSVAFSGTPSEGMIQTNSSGLQLYHNSAWHTVTLSN